MKKVLICLCAILLISGCVKKTEQTKNNTPEAKNNKEQEFNNSGRAKAIIDETDLWPVFESSKAGFIFKYPHEVALVKDKKDNLSEGALLLNVSVQKIDDIDEPGFDRETVLKTIADLSEGEYGSAVDWSVQNSKKVVKLGSINAQDFVVLSRFEVCNVVFERKLVFYNSGYRVIISLTAPKKNVIENMPEYFKIDQENCGAEQIWDFEKQSKFYDELKKGKGAGIAKEWFSSFDKIVKTVKLDGDLALENSIITNERIILNGKNKNAEIVLPKVKGAKMLSFKNIVGKTKEEAAREYKECECGVVGADYESNYENDEILSLSISIDHLGAYPSSEIKNYVINLKNKQSAKITEIFRAKELKGIASLANNKLKTNIEEAKEKAKKNNWDVPPEEFERSFTVDDLNNFVVSEDGIEFVYDFNFPNAIREAEPDSEIFFTYAQLNNYIAPRGLLAEKRK